MFNYANAKGYDTTIKDYENDYPDESEVAKWARDAMKWANTKGIINGTKRNGVLFLDPKGKATRAQVAQMVKNFQEKFIS